MNWGGWVQADLDTSLAHCIAFSKASSGSSADAVWVSGDWTGGTALAQALTGEDTGDVTSRESTAAPAPSVRLTTSGKPLGVRPESGGSAILSHWSVQPCGPGPPHGRGVLTPGQPKKQCVIVETQPGKLLT